MEEKEVLYFAGTKIRIEYIYDGHHKCHDAILAQIFEEDFVFQIIAISEYEAGLIDGYIRRQFKDIHAVTYDYLYKESEEMIYSKIIKLEIFDDSHSETIEEMGN